MSFLQIYVLLPYYVNQIIMNLERFKSGIQSKAQIALYGQVTSKGQELLLLKKQHLIR